MLLCTATTFSLMSCNNSSDDKSATDEKTGDSTTASANTENAAPSTIVTTPENMMVVIHKVSNFAKWKASYDAHDSMRVAGGIHNYVVARGVEDSNTVMVALKVEDIAKAKAFANDPSLKTAMQKGGVIGKPEMMLNTMVFQDTSTQNSKIRSITTFKVKDWDAWRKAFESHKQERLDNGIADRAYGYDVDDNHKVKLVTVINDTAKARAFWNSDLLKQRRAESGVEGSVTRFLYQVVQRY
jgi:hypothetical protein